MNHNNGLGGQFRETLRRMQGLRVLVIGDAMLDFYLEGSSNRLCQEAPVPVVAIKQTRVAPGGAANTAANSTHLGGHTDLLALIGDDADGDVLRESLRARGVGVDQLLVCPGRRTLAKRRVLSSSQLLVRFDEGTTEFPATEIQQSLVMRLKSLWQDCQAVIVSDYGYGVLSPDLVHVLGELQRLMPRVLTVDSKNLTELRQVGVTAVKPNYAEVTRLLGIASVAGTCARAEQVADYESALIDQTGAQIVAVTLDSEGALVMESGRPPYRTYAEPQPDSHAAGAGDTFLSALGLALAAGADATAAAEIASAAASIVVGRVGTTTCSHEELAQFFVTEDKFWIEPSRLAERLAAERQKCRRIVFTNGCFDILHRGHISYLNQAKALGDILVVAVNSDDGVKRLKGPGRPINSLQDRVSVLAALSCVDHIVSFDSNTPEALIRLLRPDIFVKGGDYTRDMLPEARAVEELGGTVEILPYLGDQSTTGIIQRIRTVQEQVPL